MLENFEEWLISQQESIAFFVGEIFVCFYILVS
jgi:Ca2+/Na+ antiporter